MNPRVLLAGLRMVLVMTLLLGLLYPLAVTVVAQVTMGERANGSLVERGGSTVGSTLLGQAFEGDEWFHPRPGTYDPLASGASNLGPTNPVLTEEVAAQADAVRTTEGVGASEALPVDAVTTSGSGLDPDISLAYAHLQISRVARARGVDTATIEHLVDLSTFGRQLGFLGEPRVNVLMLNLSLEDLDTTS